MTANELAAELFKRGKRVAPKQIYGWHKWEVPITLEEANTLDEKQFGSFEKRKFGEFSWHLSYSSGTKLEVWRPIPDETLEERVSLLRGPVEGGIE